MNNIFFIAVNYNNSGFTEEYIKSIKKINFESVHIKVIIVDNDSKSEDLIKLEKIIKNYNNVLLIKNDKNLGYFKALNKGLQHISEIKKDFVIIGNNDLTFNRDFIKKLCVLDYKDNILALAPDIITKDGKHQNPHVVNRVPLFKRLFYKLYFTNYYFGQFLYFNYQKLKSLLDSRNTEVGKQMEIYMGIGACYVLTPNFFNYYNKLDDRVFMWGEEALFGNQIKKVDGKILYTPSLKVNHYESATVSNMPSKKKYEMTKESFKIYSKYL
jgi:GT2 family glycosyltransferase